MTFGSSARPPRLEDVRRPFRYWQLGLASPSNRPEDEFISVPRRNLGDAPTTDAVAALELHQERLEEIRRSSTLTLAPMMDYTDRHFRQLVRLVSNCTLLYTEMVSANAVAHERRSRSRYSAADDNADNNKDDPLYMARFLAQSPKEGPSILQLGGSDPQLLFEATRAVTEMTQLSYRDLDPTRDYPSSSATSTICDYTGFNLNCGCPSPKVAGKGCFGAALMDDPQLVRELVKAMHEGGHGQYPVSVKCRIGTDTGFDKQLSAASTTGRYKYEEDEYAKLCHFIETVSQDGIVTDFSVHARIAVLGKSFSPADNRKIPPLRHDIVGRLVHDYPELRFTINGGFNSLDDVQRQLQECPGLAGVMVGRAWAADPWSFAVADSILYNDMPRPVGRNRWNILEEFGTYADHEEQLWGPGRIRRFLLRAVSPLFAGEPNAKKYRIALDEIATQTKRLHHQQESSDGMLLSMPPLSELLLDAANKHLSQDVLFRSPEESYEMRLWQEKRKNGDITVVTSSGTSTTLNNIAEWQQERKSGESTYNQTLQQGLIAGT